MKLLLIFFIMFTTYKDLQAIEFRITSDGLFSEAESTNEKIKSETKFLADKIQETNSIKEIEKEVIEQLQKMQKEYELLINKFSTKIKELEEQQKEIETQKLQLDKDKRDLAKSNERYSFGLIASLGGLFLAMIKLFFDWPLRKLEMKLKELEIKEKEN